MAVDQIARMMALDAAQHGGGGGGTSDYTDLTNKPKINGVTLAGSKSLSDIGAADASETYTDAEVDALLADKADLSILTPMTQAQYDALVTKTAPLYFIYEDGEGT